LLFIVFSIPAVQTYFGQKATKQLNDDYNTNINIEKVDFSYLGKIRLKNVLIRDYKKDTLIFVKEIKTSLETAKNFVNNNFTFGPMHLEGMKLFIDQEKDSSDSNLDIFVARFDEPNKDPNYVSSFKMSSDKVSISNGEFRYLDKNISANLILDFKDLNLAGHQLKIRGPKVFLNVDKLVFKDKSGMEVKNMTADFSYSRTAMNFKKLKVKTLKSELSGEINFNYKRENLKHFTDKVQLDATIDNSSFATDEINIFYNEFEPNSTITLKSKLSGTLNKLITTGFNMQTKGTKIQGNINFDNLFSRSKPFLLNGDFTNVSSNYDQLKKLMPKVLGKTIPSSVRKLGRFKMTGKSKISEKKLISDFTLKTAIGTIISKLNITAIDNIDQASYDGDFSVKDFNLSYFLGNKDLGKISFDAQVKGKGFVQKYLNTQFKGKIASVDYNNYRYKNIALDGFIKDNLFDGKLQSKDKNASFDFKGLIDFTQELNLLDFESQVYYADLNKLNFVSRDSIAILKGEIHTKLRGNKLDNIAGIIHIESANYTNQSGEHIFKPFHIISSFEEQKRTITIDSDEIIKGKLSGIFSFNDVEKLFSNAFGSLYPNYIEKEIAPGQYMNFNFKINNHILEVFYPDLKIANNTLFKGKIKGKNNSLKFTFKSKKVSYKDNHFAQIKLDIDNKFPLYNTALSIDNAVLGEYPLQDLSLINVTLNDTLFIRTDAIGGIKKRDRYQLSLYHTLDTLGNLVLGFKKSDIIIRDKPWIINEKKFKNAKITYNLESNDLTVNPIDFSYGDEKIAISGFSRGKTEKDFKFKVNNVLLENIYPQADSLYFKGKIDGFAFLKQENGVYKPNADLNVTALKINNILLGDVALKVSGNEGLSKYNVKASIVADTKKSLDINGYLDIESKVNQLSLDVKMYDFLINPYSALGAGVLENIRGDLDGNVHVSGMFKNPNITGNLFIDNGGMYIPYLNVDYTFEEHGMIQLHDQVFDFKTIKITDSTEQTQGVLQGTINHHNFEEWYMNLTIESNNLLALNTDEDEDGELLYYGKAFINGNAKFIGATDELHIKVNAKTNKGTEFIIPLTDIQSLEEDSLIHFLSPEEKAQHNNITQEENKEITIENKGLQLDFDLDVTPDATVTIVIDKENGSYLKGNGTGNLTMLINTNGNFNMYGDFWVDEGTYRFRYFDLIDKSFKVKQDSYLSWDGNPYEARLAIEAVYSAMKNPFVLLENPTINRKIPVDVSIKLTEKLLHPKIEFAIDFPENDNSITTELEYHLSSKDEVDKQAIALLSLGYFIKKDNSNFSAGDAAMENLTEKLNSIIDKVFSGNYKGIRYSVDLDNGEKNLETNTRDSKVGLTLETKISDRVLINGKVAIPISGNEAAQTIGDIKVEFLLNEDGTFRATMFGKPNELRYGNISSSTGYTKGVGLSYHVDFETFKELIDKLFGINITKEQRKEKRKARKNSKAIRKKQKEEYLKNNSKL
jgi:hypothetical protein